MSNDDPCVEKNLFVIGDLVHDHTVFVVDVTGRNNNPVEDERVYRVLRRHDTAGGAANSARMLAVLNKRDTSLWGVLGACRWGDFRTLLANCHIHDGAHATTHFRAVADESGAPINTITRLVKVTGEPPDYRVRHHESRFHDYLYIHIPDEKRESVLFYLERAVQKHGPLAAILINDLDMGALTGPVIQKIEAFADERAIPILIDPKRRRDKYEGVRATAILPNLREWCHFVNDDESKDKDWKTKIWRPDGLVEMARRSLYFLRGFQYHVIKCDKDGAVLVAPHPVKPFHQVFHFTPHASKDPNAHHQLGCGDVMAAVLAAEFNRGAGTNGLLEAFKKANAVVAYYRRMEWNRMPPPDDIRKAFTEAACSKALKMTQDVASGICCLPQNSGRIELQKAKTAVDGITSVDDAFKVKLNDLLSFIRDQWDSDTSGKRHVILGAEPGSGKTKIISMLQEVLGEEQVHVVKGVDLKRRLDEAEELVNGYRKGKHVVIVDEALKAGFDRVLAKGDILPLLNETEDVRFMFVDDKFRPPAVHALIDNNEAVIRRCRTVLLPGLKQRLSDMPYIVAQVLRDLSKSAFNEVQIETRALLTLIDSMLLNAPTIADLCKNVKQTYNNASSRQTGKEKLVVKFEHVPSDWQRGEDRELPDYVSHKILYIVDA